MAAVANTAVAKDIAVFRMDGSPMFVGRNRWLEA
jgi:hypothetical protein